MGTNNEAQGKKRAKELSVPEKVALITHASRGNPTNSKLAKQYGISSSTVSRILKRKHEYLSLAKSLARENGMHRKRKFRNDPNALLNSLVYKWYQDAIARSLHVSGPMLRDKALRLAAELHITDFKASNGWIDNFRQRYQLANTQAALTSLFDKSKQTETVDEMSKASFEEVSQDNSFTSFSPSPAPNISATDEALLERIQVLEQQIQAMQTWRESFERTVTCHREEDLATFSEKTSAHEAQIESILHLLKDQPAL